MNKLTGIMKSIREKLAAERKEDWTKMNAQNKEQLNVVLYFVTFKYVLVDSLILKSSNLIKL